MSLAQVKDQRRSAPEAKVRFVGVIRVLLLLFLLLGSEEAAPLLRQLDDQLPQVLSVGPDPSCQPDGMNLHGRVVAVGVARSAMDRFAVVTRNETMAKNDPRNLLPLTILRVIFRLGDPYMNTFSIILSAGDNVRALELRGKVEVVQIVDREAVRRAFPEQAVHCERQAIIGKDAPPPESLDDSQSIAEPIIRD